MAGKVLNCSTTGSTVITSPVVAAYGATATGSVLVSASNRNQGAITCNSTLGEARSVIVTVSTFSVTLSSQRVVAGGSYVLTAQNGTLSSCVSSNPTAVPNPTLAADRLSAVGRVAEGTAAGSLATITCSSSDVQNSAVAMVTVMVSASGATTGLSLSSVGYGKLTSSSAVLTAMVDGVATGYWMAIPYATSAPTQPSASQLKGGLDASGAAVLVKGSGAMTANTATEFSIAGLTVSTKYQIFFFAEDASGNAISITPVTFTTKDAPPPPHPTLSTTIVPAANHTGMGNFYVAALVPKSAIPPSGAVVFFTSKGWSIWTGGALLPYSQELLQSKTISILDGTLDVGALVGTDIYSGYGFGDDLILKKIYTIK